MDLDRFKKTAYVLMAWVAAWSAMALLQYQLDLANLAMLLVLASAVSALWLPGWLSVVISALAVLAFNWFFVPPKFTLSVDHLQNALLLLAMLLVNWMIAGLMIRQRQLADAASQMAVREAQLRQWGDTLRQATNPAHQAAALQDALAQATGCEVAVWVLRALGGQADAAGTLQLGITDAEQGSGMAWCLRDGHAMGAGTGRYDHLPDVYLPLRGRGVTLGAALVKQLGHSPEDLEIRPHLQALCDQMGSALLGLFIAAKVEQTRQEAQTQATRSALLAAISHDYRTPLATIMGAASSLRDQGDRMDGDQRSRLAQAIVEESERLARLTDNTLQLARLDAPAVNLRCDWESAEEIVGAVLRRLRRRPDANRIRAWVQPELPLVWCDAMLVSQLLDNLLDNALKYSPNDAPVELRATHHQGSLVLGVSDRGPGIDPAWREKVFDVFQRGQTVPSEAKADAMRGAGVGLAVCRAIAKAHRGELLLRARGEGGCLFECRLPLAGEPGGDTGRLDINEQVQR